MTKEAQHFEAIKYSLRQSKDGVVVAFVVQPEDVKPELMALAVGARVMVAWSAIGDDEKPVASVSTPRDSSERSPPQEPPQAQKQKRERTLAEQLAIACQDVRFHSFLNSLSIILEGKRATIGSAWHADAAIKHLLGIDSKALVNPENARYDANAAAAAQDLLFKYRDWQAQQDYGALAR